MLKSNPLKKWRTVAQVAEQCGVTPQAIRDAIKVGKKKVKSFLDCMQKSELGLKTDMQSRKI